MMNTQYTSSMMKMALMFLSQALRANRTEENSLTALETGVPYIRRVTERGLFTGNEIAEVIQTGRDILEEAGYEDHDIDLALLQAHCGGISFQEEQQFTLPAGLMKMLEGQCTALALRK